MPAMQRSASRGVTCGEQPDRLEQVAGHHRHHHVELEAAARAGRRRRWRRCRSTWAHTISVASGQHRVDLAGHDARPRLQVGQVDLREPGRRSRRHPAQVVADLGEPDGDGAQLAGQLDERVLAALRLEVVAGLGEGQSGLLGEVGDHLLGEAVRGVDAGADRRAAERELGHAGERRLEPLDAQPHDRGVPTELLAEHHRRRVHQVRAAGLHDVLELLGLGLEAPREVVQRRDEVAGGGLDGGDVDAGREGVVARLAGVDVVVGVHVDAGAWRTARRAPRSCSCWSWCPSRSGRRRSGRRRGARRR